MNNYELYESTSKSTKRYLDIVFSLLRYFDNNETNIDDNDILPISFFLAGLKTDDFVKQTFNSFGITFEKCFDVLKNKNISFEERSALETSEFTTYKLEDIYRTILDELKNDYYLEDKDIRYEDIEPYQLFDYMMTFYYEKICALIKKSNGIDDFMDSDFLEDYAGYSFKLDKNDIIAIDDGYTTSIDYDENIDKKVSSIFQIIRDKSAECMIIEKKAKKIVVSLPEQEFSNYDMLRKNDNFQNIIFAMIAIPALTYCLKDLQDKMKIEEYDMDSIEMDYYWFISVKNAYKKQFGIELTTELFKNAEISVLAQKLLNDGSLNGIKDLFEIAIKKRLNGGDEDE